MGRIIEIVAAHPLELKELRKKLEFKPFKRITSTATCTEFLFEDVLIKAVISGVGKDKVESKFYPLFQKERMPSILLNIGFAGALDPKLNWGEWILCSHICHVGKNLSQEDFFASDSVVLEEACKYLSGKKSPFQVGSLVTSDEACSSAKSKGQLFEETKALAVDMEGYHIAKVALEKNVCFLPIKIISDTMHDFVEDAVKSRGLALSRRIAEVLPGLIIGLVSLDENKRSYSHT